MLVDSYAKSDEPKAHIAIGGGSYRVNIELPGGLVEKIKQIKSRPQTSAAAPAQTPTPNQVIAQRNGYDQSVQTRNRLERNLPAPTATAQPTASATPQPQPHPTPTPMPTATATAGTSGRDISQMGMSEKLQIVFAKAIEHLGPEAAEKFKQLLTPENITIMVGTTAALIAVQGVPFLDVAVDAVVLGIAAYSLDSEAINVIGDLVNFATKTAGATTEADLDSAAQSLAKATATVGVDTLAALLIHKGVKSIKAGEILPPNTRVVEMVTPEGIRVKVRVPIEEPINPNGSNVLESRANGYPNQRIPSSEGSWMGKPGESGWTSTKPEVTRITNGEPIPFKNGFPDFAKWVIGRVRLGKMTGKNRIDFKEADKIHAQAKGWFKNGEPDWKRVENLRAEQNLTWHHHQDGVTMELLPSDLNGKVPHTGGASSSRRSK